MTTAPFALLEDTETGRARLLTGAVERLAPTAFDAVPGALARLEALRREGALLAGHVGYEAGHALEAKLAPLRRETGEPLMNIAAYSELREMDVDAVDAWLAERSSGTGGIEGLAPLIGEADYGARFARIIEAIRAGDIYQANLTFPMAARWHGDPLAIYRAIRPRAAARFAAIIFDGREWLLSFSPELFFRASGHDIETRPMKGTRPRSADAETDAANERDLATSRKDRAENLMITDLMRNDLSRLAVPGTVRVDEPFRIERYPTVFQMTSTVRARLTHGFDVEAVFAALFPCGSITGAPKLRAMEIIDEVEGYVRGPYCGAIGEIAGNEARFNVAIRTLRLMPGGTARYGVGSGVVADSDAGEEWRECLDKARFLTA